MLAGLRCFQLESTCARDVALVRCTRAVGVPSEGHTQKDHVHVCVRVCVCVCVLKVLSWPVRARRQDTVRLQQAQAVPARRASRRLRLDTRRVSLSSVHIMVSKICYFSFPSNLSREHLYSIHRGQGGDERRQVRGPSRPTSHMATCEHGAAGPGDTWTTPTGATASNSKPYEKP